MGGPVIIGIDCGVGGGIAFSHGNGTVHAINMPDTSTAHGLEKLRSILFYYCKLVKKPCIAYVEDVPPFVGTNRPAARIFKLAKNYGEVLGILTGLQIDYVRVRPAVWMKAIGTNRKKHYKTDNEWKNYLKKLAIIYFPILQSLNPTDPKTPTLKTADALLILRYGTSLELYKKKKA